MPLGDLTVSLALPCHVGSPGTHLSLLEKELATSNFLFVFPFLYDYCPEILGEFVFCNKYVRDTLERKSAMKWKSCHLNQSDQWSFPVWSDVKFDPLRVVSVESETAIDIASELQDTAKQICSVVWD